MLTKIFRRFPDWYYMRWFGKYMSRCRVCKSSKDVIIYDPRGIWAYFFRKTYCPEHCPDHDYVYCRYDGHYCNHCGQPPHPDWYADRY